jgi:hypothetical protein
MAIPGWNGNSHGHIGHAFLNKINEEGKTMSDEMARKRAEEIAAMGDPLEAGRRAQACGAEIDVILKKYNCMLDAQVMISQTRGIMTKYSILPKMSVQMPGMPSKPDNSGLN